MQKKRDISVKTTGQLADELITNALKSGTLGPTPEFEGRYEALAVALAERIGPGLSVLIHDLTLVSLATWQAQEIVMSDASDTEAALAARQAQRLNAKRTRLIREIDRVLGDAGITITTKTYG